MKNFCKDPIEHATEIINFAIKEMLPLTKKEKKKYKTEKCCHICKKKKKKLTPSMRMKNTVGFGTTVLHRETQMFHIMSFIMVLNVTSTS